MVGCASLRNRGRNPAADEAQATADVGQLAAGSKAFTTCHVANPQGGSGNGAQIGSAKRSWLSDLYQDAAPGGSRGACGRRVSTQNPSNDGELSSSQEFQMTP